MIGMAALPQTVEFLQGFQSVNEKHNLAPWIPVGLPLQPSETQQNEKRCTKNCI